MRLAILQGWLALEIEWRFVGTGFAHDVIVHWPFRQLVDRDFFHVLFFYQGLAIDGEVSTAYLLGGLKNKGLIIFWLA